MTAERIAHEWSRVVAALRRADADLWAAPTRLAGWTVEDLVRHVHWGVTLETEGLTLVGAGVGRARGVHHTGPASDLPDAVAAAVDALVAAVERAPADPGAVVPMPYGDVPLGVALDVFVMEAAVHRSDLAHALAAAGHPAADVAGPGEVLTPATTSSTAAFLQGFWDALATGAPRPAEGTAVRLEGSTVSVAARFADGTWAGFDGPATTTVRGDDSAVLLFALGRIPLDDRLAVVGDREHAVRLKEYLPGP